MFDLFRSRAKAVRYLLGALLMLVAISMVITLIPGFGTNVSSNDQIVAEVGKEPITVLEVQQSIQAQMRGRNLPAEMAAAFVPQYIDQLVTENALAYQAERILEGAGFRDVKFMEGSITAWPYRVVGTKVK